MGHGAWERCEQLFYNILDPCPLCGEAAPNLILRYSKAGDLVLDQMCGCGTTLIECKLTGRNLIGIDMNPKMVEMTEKNLRFDSPSKVNIEVKNPGQRSGFLNG